MGFINIFSKRLINKASSSFCKQKVSAVAFDHKGDTLGYSSNRPRFVKKGGGVHAEMVLMRQYGRNIKTIIICRVNKSGELLPIHPCSVCSKKAEELGIKIISIKEDY